MTSALEPCHFVNPVQAGFCPLSFKQPHFGFSKSYEAQGQPKARSTRSGRPGLEGCSKCVVDQKTCLECEARVPDACKYGGKTRHGLRKCHHLNWVGTWGLWPRLAVGRVSLPLALSPNWVCPSFFIPLTSQVSGHTFGGRESDPAHPRCWTLDREGHFRNKQAWSFFGQTQEVRQLEDFHEK